MKFHLWDRHCENRKEEKSKHDVLCFRHGSLERLAKTAEQLVLAYAKLESLLQLFSVSQILSFDQQAYETAENLRQQRIRIGTLDLRIEDWTV